MDATDGGQWAAGTAPITIGEVIAFALALLLAALAMAFPGCEEERDASSPVAAEQAKAGTIDERRGTYRGVGIGHSRAQMWRVFGRLRPAGPNEPLTPTGSDYLRYRGPWTFDLTPGSARAQERDYRYRDVSFFFVEKTIRGFQVTRPGAQTRRGVTIGDPLAKARQLYPALRCGTVNEDTEYQPYPACAGRIALARYIWFGGDPIANVTIATRRLEGV